VRAAFAVYVFQQHKLDFETHLKHLVGEQGFSSWARRRLQILEASFPVGSQPAKILADLAFQLPITLAEASGIRERGGTEADLLERLKNDLWIEEHEGALVAAHDVFADAIAARYIFEAGRSAKDRAVTILRSALLNGYFEKAIASFIRLGSHPDYNNIDRLEIVKEFLVTDEERLLIHSASLIRFGLLSKREILTLLAGHTSLRSRVLEDSNCDIAVARLAQYVNTSLRTDAKNNTDFRQLTVNVLTPFLDKAIARNRGSDFIIGQALLLDQERYRNLALTRLKNGTQGSRTGLLIEAWLKSDLPILDVEDEFKEWFSVYGESLSGAAFVYRAFLARELGLSLVSPYIYAWLSKNGTSINAGMVFTALLNRSEDSESLKYFLPWLAINCKYAGAGRVIQGWLLKGNAPEKVQPYLVAWLGLHSDRLVAGYVCKEWLEKTSDIDSILEAVKYW
jgi:hypothetical protein